MNNCSCRNGSITRIDEIPKVEVCLIHNPVLIDSGASFIKRWEERIQTRKTSLTDEFERELNFSRHILSICLKHLQDGFYAFWRSKNIDENDIAELRKFVDDVKRKFTKSKVYTTKRNCLSQLRTLNTHLHYSQRPNDYPTAPFANIEEKFKTIEERIPSLQT